MSDSKIRAACTSCGKTYRVPSPAKTYTCKECGGRIVAGAKPPNTEELDQRRERGSAARELARAMRSISIVRVIYVVQALVTATLLLDVIRGLGDPLVSLELSALSIAILAGLLIMFVTGIQLIAQNPLFWSVSLALLFTLGRLAETILGEPVSTATLVLQWLFVAVQWLLVLPCRRVSKLIEAHPDLYAAHRLRGTADQHSLRDRSARSTAQHARLLEDTKRRAWTRAGLTAGLIAIGSFGASTLMAKGRPESINSVVQRLETAWEANGPDALIAALAGGGAAKSEERLALRGALESTGWADARPLPIEIELQAGYDRSIVALVAPDDQVLMTSWTLDEGGDWLIHSYELPPPPLEPLLEQFVGAWNASSPQRVAALFKEDSRDKMVDHIERLTTNHDWGQAWPRAVDWEGRVEGQGAEIHFDLGQGSLRTRWRVSDDFRWVLRSIKPLD